MNTEEQQRLRQIREKARFGDATPKDVDFLLSIVKSQEVATDLAREAYDYYMGPNACGNFTCACGEPAFCGMCGIRQHFERWLSGQPVESSAATSMRSTCVERVREMRDKWERVTKRMLPIDAMESDEGRYVDCANEIIEALESLTLQEQEAKQS